MTIDPSTGNQIHLTEHRMLVTAFDDAVYIGVMVYLYDMTGVSRFFLALPSVMAENGPLMQSLRYGVMFASMLELRRWLTTLGLPTDASEFVNALINMFGAHVGASAIHA